MVHCLCFHNFPLNRKFSRVLVQLKLKNKLCFMSFLKLPERIHASGETIIFQGNRVEELLIICRSYPNERSLYKLFTLSITTGKSKEWDKIPSIDEVFCSEMDRSTGQLFLIYKISDSIKLLVINTETQSYKICALIKQPVPKRNPLNLGINMVLIKNHLNVFYKNTKCIWDSESNEFIKQKQYNSFNTFTLFGIRPTLLTLTDSLFMIGINRVLGQQMIYYRRLKEDCWQLTNNKWYSVFRSTFTVTTDGRYILY